MSQVPEHCGIVCWNFPAILYAALAFWRTKRLARRLQTRADVIAWRDRQLDRFLSQAIGKVPFYAHLGAARLDELPIIDKSILLANFDRLNTKGLSQRRVREALDRNERYAGGLMIGQSTGTSGNRGYYVISDAERFIWLGTILAKALPERPLDAPPRRTCFCPASRNSIAAAASDGRRIALRFFDLGLGVDAWGADDLAAFAPESTIVAPPRCCVDWPRAASCPARHIFSGAEVLDPLDRSVIEAATRAPGCARSTWQPKGCSASPVRTARCTLPRTQWEFEWEPSGERRGLMTPVDHRFHAAYPDHGALSDERPARGFRTNTVHA